MGEIATDICPVLLKCPLPPAPSAAPDPVTLTGVTSSSITVQWGEVECIDRNGEITGYSVRYEEKGSGSPQTMSASGDFSGGMYVISDLEPSTTYSIEVAAVNDELIGRYSNAVNQLTVGMCMYAVHMPHIIHVCMYVSYLQSKLQSYQLLL